MKANQIEVANLILEIPTNEFDSHEFIRHFAKRFEREYVRFLNDYDSSPFKAVHSQIAKFLADNQLTFNLKDNGTAISPNVFGLPTQNESWIK